MSFSRELFKRRTKLNLSLRSLAELIEISPTTLWRMENGVGILEMNIENAIAISLFFKWSLNDIGKRIKAEGDANKKEKTCPMKAKKKK